MWSSVLNRFKDALMLFTIFTYAKSFCPIACKLNLTKSFSQVVFIVGGTKTEWTESNSSSLIFNPVIE